MDGEGKGVARGKVSAEYEAPAITSLGSAAELTAGVPQDESSITVPSDRILKQDLGPIEAPLERLRTIRTRSV